MTDEEKKAQEAAAAAAAQAGNAGGEGGKEGEKPADKLPREVLFERVRTSRPDAKYDEDEEEIYRQLTAMLDEAEEGNGKYKGLTEKLMRRYQDDPEEVAALLDYMEGMPLVAAIRKHKGDEALTLQEGDEGWDEFVKVGEARKKDRERYENLMNEIQSNTDATVAAFDKWAEDNKLDDDQRKNIWDTMSKDLDKMSRGIFDDEIFARYYKAENYDADVEGAEKQGEANGKNAAIEAKKEEMKGSGLPGMGSGAAKKPERELTERERKAQSLSFLKG